jgi:hypothetical protein
VELTASIVFARRQNQCSESRVAIEFEVSQPSKGIVLLVVVVVVVVVVAESFTATEYSLRLRRSWVKGKGGMEGKEREKEGREGEKSTYLCRSRGSGCCISFQVGEVQC